MRIRVRGKSVISGLASIPGYFAGTDNPRLRAPKIRVGSGTNSAFQQWGGLKRKIATWLLVCAGLLISACSDELPSYRYKLTVEVETPEGLRTGSSVIEIRTSKSSNLQPGGIVSRARGEAVAVDLGPRGTLFALLTSQANPNNAAGIAPSTLLPRLVDRSGTAEAWGNNLRALTNVRRAAPAPFTAYPMLVRFRDIRNSLTVEEVQPNNLSRAFGTGVRLARISVEITDEPVSSQLNNVLPWIGDVPEIRLDPQFRSGINPGLPQMLSHGDFKKTD